MQGLTLATSTPRSSRRAFRSLATPGNAWAIFNFDRSVHGYIDNQNGLKDIQRDWMVKVCLIPCALPSSLMLIF